MVGVIVREAVSETDLRAVQALRYEVYTAEMGLYADTADQGERLLKDRHDEGALQLLGLVNGVASGTVRLHTGPFPRPWAQELDLGVFAKHVPVERMAFGSRFTVLPAHRGTPVVLELVKGCFRASLAAGCELLVLDCVPHLMNLYESLGWRRYTSRTLQDEATGVLVPMALVLRDREHLLSVRSPFVELLDELEPGSVAPAWVGEYFHSGDEDLPEQIALHPPAILEGLEKTEVAALLERSWVLDLEPGHVFVRQGTVYRTLFVVLEGGVEVSRDGVSLCDLGQGEVLGELSWLLGSQRTADVCASHMGARVLALHEGTLKAVMRRNPTIGVKLMSNLARTLATRLVTTSALPMPAMQGAL